MTTTRFPNGVTNVSEGSIFAELGQLAPPLYHTYMEDFDYYVQSQWNESIVGTATIGNQNIDGGALYLTMNSGGDQAVVALDRSNFALASVFDPTISKKMWLEVSIAAQTPSEGAVIIGLGTPSQEGLFFSKPDGSDQFEFWVKPTPGSPYIQQMPSAALTNTSWLRLGFVLNPGGMIQLFVNGRQVGAFDLPQGAFPVPQTPIGPYALANSVVANNTLVVDYIFACKER